MSASVPRSRHGSRRFIAMAAAAAVLAAAALVASSVAHGPASGATIQGSRSGSGVPAIGVDAWFNDPGFATGVGPGGRDAWFNDPAMKHQPVLRFDAWYEDPAPGASPASFDAWFNDR